MHPHFSSARFARFLLLSCVTTPLAGCGGAVDDDEAVDTSQFAYAVPAKGTATTLDVATYNLEWFGDTTAGPTDDTLQRQNVADVIMGADLDIWGLQEVVSATQFATLKSSLTGYAGFLSNDATVTSGSSYYTSSEQKVGILYKTSMATFQSAKLILTSSDYNFGGRPPMEVKLSVMLNGTTETVVVIVLHAKALADATSYQRRVNASTALKSYLDATYPTQKVVVLGDFNDDLDQSITGGASPYANFLSDSARYQFATKSLSDAGTSTRVSGGATIDHILLTNEMAGMLLLDSPLAYRVNTYITSYSTTTTDHFPVLSRFSWGVPAQLVLNEICANEPGSDVAGEFVEIVNIGGATAALGGYTISDATSVRHTFAAGTSLARPSPAHRGSPRSTGR